MVADSQGTVPVEVLVAVVAVLNLMVQGILQAIGYFVSRKPNGQDKVLEDLRDSIKDMAERREEESHMIRDLYDMHRVTDSDGRPIWYFPSNLAEMEKEQLACIREISNSQRDIAKILEGLVRQFDRIERRADKHVPS